VTRSVVELGTAPRRIRPGVWETRKGRRLTAAGNNYWEAHYNAGLTDGKGHVDKQRVAEYRATLAKAKYEPKATGIPKGQKLTPLDMSHPTAKQKELQVLGAPTAKHGSALAGLAGRQILSSIEGIPGGAILFGKSFGQDAYDVARGRNSDRTGRLLAQMLKQIPEDVLHARERPGYLAMDVVGGAGAIAGAGGKLGLAGKAGTALPRTLRYGGLETTMPPSRSVFGRLIQNTLDPALQRRLSAGEVPGGAAEGGVFSALGKFGRSLAREHKTLLARDQGPVHHFTRFLHGKTKLSAEETKAYEAVARGHSLETMAKAHARALEQALAKGDRKAVANHVQHFKLTQAAAAARQDVLDQATSEGRALMQQREKHLDMSENAAAHSLGAAHEAIAALAEGRPSIMSKIDELEMTLDPEFQKMPDPVAEIRKLQGLLKAKHTERAGAVSHIDEAAVRAKIERLAGHTPESYTRELLAENQAHQHAIEQRAIPEPKTFTASYPRTKAEAETRLANVESRYEGLVQGRVEQLATPEQRKLAQADLNRAQRGWKTRGGKARGAYKMPRSSRAGVDIGQVHIDFSPDQPPPRSVIVALRQQADAQLRAAAAKGGSATAEELRAIIAERDQLHNLLNDPEHVFGGAPPEGYGRQTHTVPAKKGQEGASMRGLRREEHQLKQFLHEAQTREKIAQHHRMLTVIGHQARRRGAFYLPFKSFEDVRGPGGVSRRPGPFGLGPPVQPKFKPVTGKGFSKGGYRTDVVKLTAEAARTGIFVNHAFTRAWPAILKAAKETPEEAGGKLAEPVRVTRQIPETLRAAISQPERGTLSEAGAASMSEHAAAELRDWLLPPRAAIDEATNTVRGTKDKILWVDPRAVGGLLPKARTGTVPVYGHQLPLGSMLDAFNAPFRVGTLARPAYAWNRAQAFLQNAIQGGVFLPVNHMVLKRMYENQPAAVAKMESVMGNSRSRALEAPKGPLSKAVNWTAEFMNNVVDRQARNMAFIHEARKAGFKSDQQIADLLTERKHEKQLVAVGQIANHEAIPFGNMSELERATLTRAMFFYPWTRASLEYGLKFPMEHPMQTGVFAQLGRYGESESQRILGHIPGWAKVAGLVPLTGGTHPLTANPSNLNTLSTIPQLEQLAESLVTVPKGGAGNEAAQLLGPGAAVLQGALTGTVRGRGKTMEPLRAAGEAAIGSLPAVTAWQRKHAPPGGTYPGGLLPALLGPLVGAELPRPTSTLHLHAQFGQQAATGADAFKAALQERSDLEKESKRLYGHGLPDYLNKAYRVWAIYKQATLSGKPLEKLEKLGRAGAALGMWEESDFESRGMAEFRKLDAKKQAARIRWFGYHRFGGKAVSNAKRAVNAHGGQVGK
jgi:hypothetical protein